MPFSVRELFLAWLCCCSVSISMAGDAWPSFRGPKGDGTSDAKGLPLTFSETENIAWKTPIHGKGWSSPVVWGNQIWMTTATEDGKQQFAVCANLESGKIVHDILLWEVENPAFTHPTNSYASCTPAIEEGRVYVHFGSYGTACLDTASGKVLWQRRDLPCDHFRGPASSPVLFQNLLIVALDGFDLQYVVALDKKTGETVWKKDRNIDYHTNNGDNKKAYSTAAIIEVGGQPQIVSPAATATIAYEPLTGQELWRVEHGGMNAAARPLFGNGMVYISAGDGGKSLVAVRADGSGDVTNSHIAWSAAKSIPKRSSQILLNDLLFMVNDSGVFSCFDALTGDLIWQERVEGNYWASPVYADGKLYFSSQEGTVLVLAAGREFKVLAENKLDDGCNASPAIVGKSLVIRTKSHLYRVEAK